MKLRKIDIIKTIVTGLIGITCLLLTERIAHLLPYLIAVQMLLVAAIMLVTGIKKKEYQTIETKLIASSITMGVLGSIILCKRENSIALISIIWGMIGLVKGTKGLNLAIYYKYKKEKYVLELIESMIEIGLSILLILYPYEKITEHIFLLGIQLLLLPVRDLFSEAREDKERVEIKEELEKE